MGYKEVNIIRYFKVLCIIVEIFIVIYICSLFYINVVFRNVLEN